MRTPLIIALLLLAAVPAAAQRRPKACRYLVDVQNKQVAATTQPRAECEYGGKILMTVNNLDNTKYRLEMRNFKFDTADPTKCAAPNTNVNTNFPINGDDGGGAFKFTLNAESTHTKKKNLRALTGPSTECFKFDLWLYEIGGTTPIFKLDPELQVSEPPPPPPGGDGRPSGPGR